MLKNKAKKGIWKARAGAGWLGNGPLRRRPLNREQKEEREPTVLRSKEREGRGRSMGL